MESNTQPSSQHLAVEKQDHPEKKKIKLDRSGLDISQPSTVSVSNGIKNDVKILRTSSEDKPQDERNNHIKMPSVHKETVSHEKLSLKRPATDSDNDDIPLVARTKMKLPVKQAHLNKSPLKDSPNSNNVTKVKKSKPEIKVSSKIEKPKNSEESVKKIKSERESNRPDSVKIKAESLKSDLVKQPKSENTSKSDGVKKKKFEGGLSSLSKSHHSVKRTDILIDSAKKAKNEGSGKIKSESGLKSPDSKKKEKQKDGLLPKVEAATTKDGVSIKTEKQKTSSSQSRDTCGLKSPTADGIKKEKHKTRPEGTSKGSGNKTNKDGLISRKSDDKTNKDGLISPKSGDKQKKDGLISPKNSIKPNKDGLTSPKVEGIKKEKVSFSKDGVKKIKSESSPEKKSKGSAGLLKGETVKKIKTAPLASTEHSTVKIEESDDDVPLASRAQVKMEADSKKKTPSSKERKRKGSDDEDDDDYKPLKKRKSEGKAAAAKKENLKKETPKAKKGKESEKTVEKGKGKEGKKEKKEEEVWKWWEEEKHPDGIKWLTLEHKGPYFPPEYEPLPDSVNFYYDGEKVKLSLKTEEVAGFYAKMLDHDYTTKKIFNDNFFGDWRKEMTDDERALIKHLSKCDFKEMHAYYVQKNEERKAMSKEEKLKIKEKNEEILQDYGYCMMDGHKERVGNFKIEPPGLFRGRGDHPKQGKLKKRLKARDVTINIGKHTKVPDPPEGQKWKAITHDNKVTWLACWIENIQGSYKYVMLNPTSRIKGEKDWQKYETARKLKNHIGRIRADYTNDWKSKEMRIRQRGVALYFIDKLALRAGHEKDEDTADTVGCCSLRYEHIKLHRNLNEKEFVVEFDFLGKDSIHYHNLVEVEKRVFKNLELFQQGKSEGDDLFDRLSTASLNKYLSELMEGLSAKVFRTYNASMTLQDQLNKLELEDNVAAKVLGYNRANRAVAILCNHQRTAPKTFEQSMSNLQQKIDDKRKAIKDSKNELKDLKHEAKGSDSVTLTRKIEKKKTAIERLKEQLFKLEVSQTDKNENKEIALGTSKLNYLDPRISIAWCLKNDVPIEKIYNKTQRQKFAWAIDMTEEDFVF